MAVRTVIDPNTGERRDKTEYPLMAVREIILNALVHRDYSIHTDSSPIGIVMYRDRLLVTNPGGLYGRLTLDTLGTFSADTRNPYLANAMEIMGETENRFSGIPTVRKEMERAKLPPPVFDVVNGAFQATLYNGNPAPQFIEGGSIYEDVLSFCLTPRSRAEISEHFQSVSPAYLMQKYVNPLVTQKKLALVFPEKPKSKYQRFYAI